MKKNIFIRLTKILLLFFSQVEQDFCRSLLKWWLASISNSKACNIVLYFKRIRGPRFTRAHTGQGVILAPPADLDWGRLLWTRRDEWAWVHNICTRGSVTTKRNCHPKQSCMERKTCFGPQHYVYIVTLLLSQLLFLLAPFIFTPHPGGRLRWQSLWAEAASSFSLAYTSQAFEQWVYYPRSINLYILTAAHN